MASKLSDLERAAIAEAIRAGKPRNEIARECGRSAGIVTLIAREMGLTAAFDRSATERATSAAEADLAAKRAVIGARLLDEASRLLDQLRESSQVIGFSAGEALVVPVKEPVAGDKRNLMTAAAIALDKHLALDRHDRTDDGLSAVDVFLREVMVTRTP